MKIVVSSIPPLRFVGLDCLASDSDTMLRTVLFALVALTTSLKLPPPAIGRRAAVCLLPACLFAPQIAEATSIPEYGVYTIRWGCATRIEQQG